MANAIPIHSEPSEPSEATESVETAPVVIPKKTRKVPDAIVTETDRPVSGYVLNDGVTIRQDN
jgi:hypothetical protein